MSYRQADELGYVSETDSGGAVWRDAIDDLLAGLGGGGDKDRSRGGAGDTGINPTTNLPWDVYPDANSPSDYVLITTGQPVYKDGREWTGETSDRRSGGTTNITYNTQAANDLGPGRYTFRTSDGSDGLPVGTTYQVDLLDGSKSNIKYPGGGSDPRDANGDGFDDTTGLPRSGGQSATTQGGKLYFQGKRIGTDGHRLTPDEIAAEDAGSGGSVGTWTGYGPKGQGTYKLDAPGGMPGTYLGPTTAAGAGASSGSSSSSGGGGLSGGGGSNDTRSGGFNNTTTNTSTSTSTSHNTSDIGPNTIARDAAERAQRAAEFGQTFGLSREQFDYQKQRDAVAQAQQQQELEAQFARDYSKAITDVNPNAVRDFLYAHGQPMNGASGGTFWNALAGGGDALNEETVAPAARLLGLIRGTSGGSTGAGGLPVTGGGAVAGAAGGGGGTTPGGGNTVPPATGGVAAGASSAPMASAPPPFITLPNGQKVVALPDGSALRDEAGNYYAYDPADKLGQGMARYGQTQYSAATGSHSAGNTTPVLVTANGEVLDQFGHSATQNRAYGGSRTLNVTSPQSQYEVYINPQNGEEMDPRLARQMGIQPTTKTRATWSQGGPNTISHGGLAANSGGTSYNFSGQGSQSIDPSRAGYATPAEQYANSLPAGAAGGLPVVFGYGDDNVQRQIDDSQDRFPRNVALMAGGGLATGPYISGDSTDNRPNPELNVPTPMGTQVIRMRDMPPEQQEMFYRTMPRHALGTSSITVGGKTYNVAAPNADAPIQPAPAPTPAPAGGLPYGNDNIVQPVAGTNPSPYNVPPVNPVVLPGQPGYPVQSGAGGLPVAGAPAAPENGGLAPQTTVSVGGGGMQPAQPTYPSSQPTGEGGSTTVTQGDANLIQEVLNQRRTATVPDANYMDVSFENIPPTQRRAYYAGLQERYGVDPEDIEAERQRYRIGGYRRGGLALRR